MSCCQLKAFIKNEGSNTKQDKLQPRLKLLEQALHKLPTRGTIYYKTHYISRETRLAENWRNIH